jgi:transcriptional regulator with XRE-family HTH domain
MKQINKKSNDEFTKLGEKIFSKRAGRGVRVVASEIGISAATLSRIERGYTSDIDTFRKVCLWLGIDAGEFLGGKSSPQTASITRPTAAVHFRKDQAIAPQTAKALADLILVAQQEIVRTQSSTAT